MRYVSVGSLILVLLFTVGCAQDNADEDSTTTAAMAAPAPAPAPPAAPAMDMNTPEGKIQSARSAAPAAISGQAAVADIDATGKMVDLAPGNNGWLCMPDSPGTPDADPVCADAAWQKWFNAYLTKAAPPQGQLGVAYMLAGGSDASNTDPHATAPATGNEWIHTPAHIMLLAASPEMLNAFPTDPKTGGPFVMWRGTPYAHLMVPVQPNM
jgi:hypothetical protein